MVTSLARSGEIIQPQQQQQRTSCTLGKHYLTPAVAISKWTDLIGWDSRNARALTVICQVSRRWIETENLGKGIEFLGNDKERLSMLQPIFFFCVCRISRLSFSQKNRSTFCWFKLSHETCLKEDPKLLTIYLSSGLTEKAKKLHFT